MSTKIYNSFIFVDVPPVDVLAERMERLRKGVQGILRELLVKSMASNAESAVDQLALGRKVYSENYNGQSLLSSVWSEIDRRNREIERTRRRDPLNDFSCEVEILPIKGKILMMTFTERREVERYLRRQWYLKDYSYWDNTDPDENVPAKEWKQREKDWDKALGDDGIPSQHGFLVTLHDSYLSHPPAEEVLKYISSYEDRVKHWSFWLAWDTAAKRHFREEKKKDPKAESLRSAIGMEKYVREDPKGKKLVEFMRVKVARKLPKTITRKMLLQPLKKKPVIARKGDGEPDE